MSSIKKISLGLLLVAAMTLAACGKTNESTTQSNDPSSTAQHTKDDATGNSEQESKDSASSSNSDQNADGKESSSAQNDDGTTNQVENTSGTNRSGQTNQAQPSTKSNTKTSRSESNKTNISKDQYLKKLNEMEEADRNTEDGKTMKNMVEQEKLRFKKWDAELNKIYGILKEQLTKEQMNNLREEQRNWITLRDKDAKESAEKYKGGSYESLEYVATQASLTKERCYELVAKYMH